MPADLTLLLSTSPSRPATGGQAPAVSTVSRTPDTRRHSAVCCCTLCEQRGTGEQAMRAVGGDYRRFLARLGIVPSSLLSPNRWRDAAASLLAVLVVLLPRRSA